MSKLKELVSRGVRLIVTDQPEGGEGAPEMGGEAATASLAVIRAGIVSAREGRRVEVAEMMSKD